MNDNFILNLLKGWIAGNAKDFSLEFHDEGGFLYIIVYRNEQFATKLKFCELKKTFPAEFLITGIFRLIEKSNDK